MKVLIVGSYGLVTGNLIARLHREKCDVYVLTGKKTADKRSGLPKHISFSFQASSADVKYVIQGIMPDYVIFTGAWDENYQWGDEDCASAFNSALVNVLSWAKAYQVPRVCYLSCMDAAKEKGSRGRLVRNGERICETYAEPGFFVAALRLPYVYGSSRCVEDTLDLLSEQCFLAKGGNDFLLPSVQTAPLYVSDLAEAIYRVGREEIKDRAYGCYAVKGREKMDGDSFRACIRHMYPDGKASPAGKLRISDTDEDPGIDFIRDFGYYPKIDIKTGLERVEVFLSKNYRKIDEVRKKRQQQQKLERQQAVKNQVRQGLTKILHIVENVVLFAAAFAAQYFIREEVQAFSGVDFLLLYIILIAVTRGVGESILAVLLSAGGNLWLRLNEGGMLSQILSQYDFVMQFLFYFVVAIGIAYSFLNNRLRLKERIEQLRELEEEYIRIIDINKTNVEIKRTFEDRLINYGDSIGKIYNVVSELDVLEVDKIMTAALRVVSRIMGVKDVSIYYSGTDDYFHFVGATTRETGSQKTILLREYQEMETALLAGDVFMNHSIGGELPRMAAPIFSGNKLVYIVMLWNIEFEELNLYKKNLFLVLVKLITSSLEKGYQYEKVGRNQEYYEETNIMLPEAFERRVLEHLEGKTREEAEYTLIQVQAQGRSLVQLNGEFGALLRDSDRIGYMKEGDSFIYILAHTNYDDAEFVVRKLAREGFTNKVVMLDEL
ncbi:MAG: hypothetical protein K2O16_04905 [Lachnospiraceae bacterium]|nr:hypothetical protein [Lachnospiraceae bacterium]